MPEETDNDEQQPIIEPQTENGTNFTETPIAVDAPETPSFVSESQSQPEFNPEPSPELSPEQVVPSPAPMTGMNIDSIKEPTESVAPMMTPESLPVQSAPTTEPIVAPIVTEPKKNKTTTYLIIAIIVVVLVTAGYFAYRLFV